MFKAGALFYAIAVSLIIALLSSSLILYSYFNTLQFERGFILQKLQLNAISGLNTLLIDQPTIPFGEKINIDLFGDGEDSVQLERRNWGGFEICSSSAFFKSDTFSKSALTGYDFFENNETALYLCDLGRPLSLCGKTIIKGTCYLPGAGVKRAYIEGQNFVGDKLIDGTIKKSSNTLPSLNAELLEKINNLLKAPFSEADSLVDLTKSELSNTLVRSFSRASIVLYSTDKITLSGLRLSGNIIVFSKQGVSIEGSALLNDILVIAPYIVMENGFSGSLQVFATDSIHIGKDCKLKYPSIGGIVPRGLNETRSFIRVSEGSLIEGILFAGSGPGLQQNSLIEIQKDAEVRGQVYSTGVVDLKGSVSGSVLCSKFLLKTPSSIYENHLLNATIDFSKLSPYFAGIGLVRQSDHKKIVKWVY